MVVNNPHPKLHLVMGIVAVGVENHQLPSIDISAKIAFPEIAVDAAEQRSFRSRLDLAARCSESSESR